MSSLNHSGAPEWDDLRTPVNAVKLSGDKPPTWTDYKGSQVLGFSDQAIEGNEERVFMSLQLPHKYIEGTNLRPHLHWVGEDNTSGNVVWALTYSWANQNAEAFPAESGIAVTAPNSGTTDYHMLSSFPSIDGTGKMISSMILCELRRNSSNVADTFTGKSAYLLEFDIHHLINTFGSRLELIK